MELLKNISQKLSALFTLVGWLVYERFHFRFCLHVFSFYFFFQTFELLDRPMPPSGHVSEVHRQGNQASVQLLSNKKTHTVQVCC